MRLYDYIWDRRFLILLYLITSLLTGTIIYMEEAGSLIDSTGLYATEISLFLFLFYLMIDFILRRKHCITLKKLLLINDMDWINSMPKPFDSEQRVYDELLHKFYQDSYKKMEEHGSKSREDLEFITMWVHEIKTPIAASKLIIENSLNEPTEKILYTIEDEIDKIEDYVHMALFYSRSNDFAMDYMIDNVCLEKIVKDCIKREYASIINKKLHIEMNDLAVIVDTDEKWLGFIVKQILDNAIKYSQPGSKIKIFSKQKEKEIVLYVEDNGEGIRVEDLSRIFEKNFTGMNGRNYYSSTGIGLYLSKKLAQKLGHLITVTSEQDEGTTVSIHFRVI